MPGRIVAFSGSGVDMLRCLVCGHKFTKNERKANVYNEDKLVGTVHDDSTCYPRLGVVHVASDSADARKGRKTN